MVTRRAWILNFDAEVELDTLGRSSSPAPSRRAALRRPELVERAGALLAPGDIVLSEEGGPRLQDVEGRAWCPTPSARAALEQRGARMPRCPPVDVLRAVNHRRFSAELGGVLPGAQFVEDLDALEQVVARPSISGPWLIKRALSFTGRGRIVVEPGSLTEPARAFCRASLCPGDGLAVEPWVQRIADFSLHGHLSVDHELAIGDIVEQRVGRTGTWESAVLATSDALDANEKRALQQALADAAHALTGRGYFGPFGVDAFRWMAPGGAPRFHACCEINARYSMAWALGMGPHRPDLTLQSDD